MSGTIAILPARGGSKRIPRKNIKTFHGKPMIHWPLKAAIESGAFDRVIVSTDDPDIAATALSEGAEVPFMRGQDLADDMTGTRAVVCDALQRLNAPGDTAVCCIYPTAAFIRSSDLQAGHAALTQGRANWAFSVAEYRTPIQRAYRIVDGLATPFDLASMPMRSQDLQSAYYDAGQFYWAKALTWTDRSAHVWDGAFPIVLDANRAIDIDTMEDWERAERAFTP